MKKNILEENINMERDIEEEYDMMPISKSEMNDMMPMMDSMYPGMQGTPNMQEMPSMQGMQNMPGMYMNPMMHMMPGMMPGMTPGMMPGMMHGMMQGMMPGMMPHMMPGMMSPCMMGGMPCMPMMHCGGMYPMGKCPGAMEHMPMFPKRMMEDNFDSLEEEAIEENERFKPQDVDRILRKIEMNNPGVFRLMRSYGIPYDVARRICRRIISLTLMYYDGR